MQRSQERHDREPLATVSPLLTRSPHPECQEAVPGTPGVWTQGASLRVLCAVGCHGQTILSRDLLLLVPGGREMRGVLGKNQRAQ